MRRSRTADLYLHTGVSTLMAEQLSVRIPIRIGQAQARRMRTWRNG